MLDIDERLMTALLARLPGRSKTYAIGSFLADDSVERLKRLAGTLEIEDLSAELRISH